MEALKFEEYKFLSESTQFLTERRQAASQTYLAINTAIITVLAFLVKDAGLKSWGLVLVCLPLFAVGVLACLVWQRMIENYRSLINWRYEQLMALERDPGLSGSHQLYNKERAEYLGTSSRRSFGFSGLEKQVPFLVLILYIVFALGMTVITAWNM
jgi:hypothetical protein